MNPSQKNTYENVKSNQTLSPPYQSIIIAQDNTWLKYWVIR